MEKVVGIAGPGLLDRDLDQGGSFVQKILVGMVSLLGLSACATVEPPVTNGLHSAKKLHAVLGPCDYKAGGQEAGLAGLLTSLGLSVIGDGVGFVIGALSDAGNSEKGKREHEAKASFVADKELPQCLYLVKGRMSVFKGQERDANYPKIEPGTPIAAEILQTKNKKEGGEEGDDSDTPQGADAGTAEDSSPAASEESSDGEVRAGARLGVADRTGNGPVEDPTPGEDSANTFDRHKDFSEVGLYFADQPDFVAVIAIDYGEEFKVARLRPVYASFIDASPGTLFRTAKSRDVVLGVKFEILNSDKEIDFGAVELGRLTPTDDSLIVYSRASDGKSLITSPWVALPDGFGKNAIINSTITMTEIQAPNAVAGYIGGVLEESRTLIDEEIERMVDRDAALAARTSAQTTENTAAKEYREALISACESSKTAWVALGTSDDGRVKTLSDAIVAQDAANVAAVKAGEDAPFKPVWTLETNRQDGKFPSSCTSIGFTSPA